MKYEDSVYDLLLLDFEEGIDGSSALQQAFGVSKEMADDFVEGMPCVVKASATEEEVSPFLAALKEVGAKVKIRPSDTILSTSLPSSGHPSVGIPLDPIEPLDLMEPVDLSSNDTGNKFKGEQSSALHVGGLAGQNEFEEPNFSTTLFRFFRRFTTPIVLLTAIGAFAWWWMSDPPVQVGPAPSEAKRVVILLHGHGASKNDLKPLAQTLGEYAPETSFILPSAPHSAGVSGKTWYPSFRASSKQEMEKKMQDYRAEAREVVMDIADELMADGIQAEDISVGGFSQGASVALDVILNEPNASDFGGLVFLSGGAIDLDLDVLSSRPVLRAFVSHGKSDRVLGIGRSNRLVKELETGGHEVTLINFEGGHSIPGEVIESLGPFLDAL